MCNRAAARYAKMDFGKLELGAMLEGRMELPRRNIAPTTPIPTLHRIGEKWIFDGPSWGKPEAAFSSTNARNDRLAESRLWKPMLNAPEGRGLIFVTDAFEPFTKETLANVGEAQAVKAMGREVVEASRKDTVWHRLHLADGKPYAIAALVGKAGPAHWSTMVTVEATGRMADRHRPKHNPADGRQIAYLPPKLWSKWLNPESADDWMDALEKGRDASTDLEMSLCPMGCMKQAADAEARFQVWKPAATKTLF